MKPYTGAIGGMAGPELYGYVDPAFFFYGERGGKYLDEWAQVSKERKTEDGKLRIPVWSDENDDIWVAVPRDLEVTLVGEEDEDTESLVWVHHISRERDEWDHVFHPALLQEGGVMKEIMKASQELRKIQTVDPLYMMMPSVKVPPISFDPSTFKMPSSTRFAVPSSKTYASLPLLDMQDGTTKTWQVPSTSKVLKQLVESGAVETDSSSHGTRYSLASGALIIRKARDPDTAPDIQIDPVKALAILDPETD